MKKAPAARGGEAVCTSAQKPKAVAVQLAQPPNSCQRCLHARFFTLRPERVVVDCTKNRWPGVLNAQSFFVHKAEMRKRAAACPFFSLAIIIIGQPVDPEPGPAYTYAKE